MSAALAQPSGIQTASHFVMKHGRLPMLGVDPSPPWAYSQWLLYYVQGVEMTPIGSGRWDHYFRTMAAGHLLDEPIPQVEFSGEGDTERSGGQKAINQWLNILFDEVGSGGPFRALIEWFLWGLGLSKEEPRLSAKTNEKLYREVNLEPLIKVPSDYWGMVYQDTKTNRFNSSGYYCSPHQICDFMCRLVMHDINKKAAGLGRDPRTMSVCEPCVGSGRMLLHASNYSYCLYGQDIDYLCVAMTKINGALYAPWMTWPFPASIIEHGVGGVAQGDSLVELNTPDEAQEVRWGRPVLVQPLEIPTEVTPIPTEPAPVPMKPEVPKPNKAKAKVVPMDEKQGSLF